MGVAEPASQQATHAAPADGGSLEGVFARCQDELLGTLYHLLGNADDARDALQDAFVKCWRRRDEIAGIENVRAWVFKVAINAGRDLRSSAWRRKREALPEEGFALPAKGLGPNATAEQAERIELLRLALANLREEEREVFLLRQNGDLTYEEAAESLGVPVGTVKTRMRLALQKLREALPTDGD